PARFAAVLGMSEAVPRERRKQILEVALRRQPGNLGLLAIRGVLEPMNTPDTAVAREVWFRAAVAVRPDNPACHISLGNALKDKGDHDAALAEFREAIRVDPKYPSAYLSLGNALKDKGRHDAALAEFRNALAADPTYAPGHYSVGLILVKWGNID